MKTIIRVWVNGIAVDGYNSGNAPTFIPELTNEITEISLQFVSEEKRDEFVKMFPKSMNVKKTNPYGYPNCQNNDWTKAISYNAKLTRMRINDITGDQNEIGDKRMIRFVEAAKKCIESQN